ncbi:hypothetical protein JCM3774_004884 [Rhodotorula dairenensis]
MDRTDAGRPALERSASVLARQLAMAKLTGQPPPPAPQGLLDPLPTLEELQRRARDKLDRSPIAAAAAAENEQERSRPRPRPRGLVRNHTVSSGTGLFLAQTSSNHAVEPADPRYNPDETGLAVASHADLPPAPSPPVLRRNNTVSGVTPPLPPPPPLVAPDAGPAETSAPPQDRSAIRANLIRKLSARRAPRPIPSPPLAQGAAAEPEPVVIVSGTEGPAIPASSSALAPPIPSLDPTGGRVDNQEEEHLVSPLSGPAVSLPPPPYPPPSAAALPLPPPAVSDFPSSTTTTRSPVPTPATPPAAAVASPTRQARAQGPEQEEDESGAGAGAPPQAAVSVRSGSVATTTTTTTSDAPFLPSSTSSSFSSSSNGTSPPPQLLRSLRSDPRLARPFPTFGIAAVEGVPPPLAPPSAFISGQRRYRIHEEGDREEEEEEEEEDAEGAGSAAGAGGGPASRTFGSFSSSTMIRALEEVENDDEDEAGRNFGDLGAPVPAAVEGTGAGGGIGLGLGAVDGGGRIRAGTVTPTPIAAATAAAGAMTSPQQLGSDYLDSSPQMIEELNTAGAFAPPSGFEAADDDMGPAAAARRAREDDASGATSVEGTPTLSVPRRAESADSKHEAVGPEGVNSPREDDAQYRFPGDGGRTTESTRAPVPVQAGSLRLDDGSGDGDGQGEGNETETTPRLGSLPPAAGGEVERFAPPLSSSSGGAGGGLAAPVAKIPSPPESKRQKFAFNLSDYRPFDPTPPPPSSNVLLPLHTHTASQTPTPTLEDPVSPTSVVPNPMEDTSLRTLLAAAAGRSSPSGAERRTGGFRDRPAADPATGAAAATTPEGPRSLTPTRTSPNGLPAPAAFRDGPPLQESQSPSPAHSGAGRSSPASESVRSYRTTAAAAAATGPQHPTLDRSSSANTRRVLSRSASSESELVTGVGGGAVGTGAAANGSGGGGGPVLPPLRPRVAHLAAADLPANRILAKLDSILGLETTTTGATTTAASGPLDRPPRRLLLSSPVLQVVNANTVKDRYLLLFTDMLVIAKPLLEDHVLTGEPVPPNLDSHFLVKSVVECKQLKLTADDDPAEDATGASRSGAGAGQGQGQGQKKHPLLVAFVDRFANDPARAIASLVSKGGLTNDGPTIANLLYRNTDLNRNQLGMYLSDRHQRHVLRAYIDRFRFAGVRIDDALRLFLMSVRLPFDSTAADYVIGVLAQMWAEANPATGIDGAVAYGLMTAIVRLSDALHGGDEPGERFFQDPKPPVPPSVDDFIASFGEVDTRSVVPEDLLARIYTAIRRERIENASDNSIFSMTPDIEATITPAKLPTQLTYRTPSARFTITIPAPDPKFTIKLQGADLQFDPPVLSFARSATQSFRVTGTALGVRTMVLIKRGANAPRYQGVPLNKAFSVERGFMQHTFQLSFTNHLDLKRKYMFSCRDAETRSRWLQLLRERIAASAAAPAPETPAQAAANAVAVQVLRDAVLAPDEPGVLSAGAPSPRPNVVAPRFGRPVTPSTPRGRLGTPTRPVTATRSNSVSRLYPILYRQEAEGGAKRPGAAGAANSGLLTPAVSGGGRSPTVNSTPDPSSDELTAARLLHGDFVRSGHELVLTTEQNSLLPLVLTFLNAGLEAAPHPLSLQGSAFQLPPRPGTSAPLPSFVSHT